MKPELCVGRHQPPEGSIPRLPTLALSQVEDPTGSVGSTAHAWTGYTGRCIATVDAGAMEGPCMGVMAAEGNRNTEGLDAEPAVKAPLGVLPSDAPKAYRDAGGDDSATFPPAGSTLRLAALAGPNGPATAGDAPIPGAAAAGAAVERLSPPLTRSLLEEPNETRRGEGSGWVPDKAPPPRAGDREGDTARVAALNVRSVDVHGILPE